MDGENQLLMFIANSCHDVDDVGEFDHKQNSNFIFGHFIIVQQGFSINMSFG